MEKFVSFFRPTGQVVGLVIVFALATGGCASRYSVSNTYRENYRETPQNDPSKSLTVLILIDGLGWTRLTPALKRGDLPGIKSHYQFLIRGRSVFPSLTYPNIASVLTAKPISGHPISGNLQISEGKEFRFETWEHSGFFNRAIENQTVFQHLKKCGQKSVSASYIATAGSTVATGLDIKDGVAYNLNEFKYLDTKALEGFSNLLQDTRKSQLPGFVFIHLIGYDAIAHELGPDSTEAEEYLKTLDPLLSKNVFGPLEELERTGVKVHSMLTADHGFVQINRVVSLEGVLNRISSRTGVRFLNQHRLISAYSKPGQPILGSELQNLSRLPGVESVIFKGPQAWVKGELTNLTGKDADLLEDYFKSPNAPQAVLLAEPHTSFTRKTLGQHGGMTFEEISVPIAMRGVRPGSAAGPISSHEILRPLFAESCSEGSYPATEPNERSSTSTLASRGDPRFKLSIGTPLRFSDLDSHSSTERTSLATRFSPGIDSSLDQIWSDQWRTRLGYGLAIENYFSDSPSIKTNTSFYHRIGLGIHYRFSEQTLIGGDLNFEQEPFLSGSTTRDPFERQWVSSLMFSTKSTVYSFGFGNLFLKGGLGILLPRDYGTFQTSTGFSQSAGGGLEQTVNQTDALIYELQVIHASQKTSYEERDLLRWTLGVTYRLDITPAR